MVASHGSDKSATDICRVLRVPGFLHRKAEPFMVQIVEAPGHRYPWAEILEAFPPIPRAETATHCRFERRDGDDERIAEALSTIPAGDRVIWFTIGAILKDQPRGRELWDRWSQGSSKYDADDQERVWRSIGTSTSRATTATLFHLAQQHGWRPPPLTAADARMWHAAGYFVGRFSPSHAWRLFSTWCERNGATEQAVAIFKIILGKELT